MDSRVILTVSISTGRNVLVVEDLIETGRTIRKLMDILLQHKPASVRVAALFVKRIKDIGVQYRPDRGYNIPFGSKSKGKRVTTIISHSL